MHRRKGARGALMAAAVGLLLLASTRAAMDGGGNQEGNAAEDAACITNSTQPSCAQYQYPAADAHADLDDLCVQMSFMPACSVYAKCNATATQAAGGNASMCDPVSLLATVCKLDGMSSMRGCSSYSKLCQTGSVVQQCVSSGGLTALPTTDQVNSEVKSICEEMSMDGCEKCTPDWKAGQTYATCDLLSVYGQLCTAMPDMRQCALYKNSCAANSALYICKGSGSASAGGGDAPVMKMYFNDKLPFYLLFRDWTPSTPASYAGAWFAIFFVGLVYEALVTLKVLLEARWACASRSYFEEDQKEPVPVLKRIKRAFSITDVYRGLIQFVVVALAYFLMLAAMSFNIGIFFAVVTGIAVGTMVFGRWRQCTPTDEPCCMA